MISLSLVIICLANVAVVSTLWAVKRAIEFLDQIRTLKGAKHEN